MYSVFYACSYVSLASPPVLKEELVHEMITTPDPNRIKTRRNSFRTSGRSDSALVRSSSQQTNKHREGGKMIMETREMKRLVSI
jgi:hypothetical protein